MRPTVQLIDDILNPCSSATAHKASIGSVSCLPQAKPIVIITTLHTEGQDRYGNPSRCYLPEKTINFDARKDALFR